MSQQNVVLVHQEVEAYNRRDLDAFLALMDPAVEFMPYTRALEGLGPYRGHAGVRTWWKESFATFPDLVTELYEVRDLGAVTLARGRLHGHGAGSGASFDRTLWMVTRWRDGKEIWWRSFASEAGALEAAEQSE